VLKEKKYKGYNNDVHFCKAEVIIKEEKSRMDDKKRDKNL
jgi:hypothetical protein